MFSPSSHGPDTGVPSPCGKLPPQPELLPWPALSDAPYLQ